MDDHSAGMRRDFDRRPSELSEADYAWQITGGLQFMQDKRGETF
jgi:hypothetical protein